VGIFLCFAATNARAAGLREIEIPADGGGPAMSGAAWYPCAQPVGAAALGKAILPATKDCPLPEGKLPLVVISHGRRGTFVGHHDTAAALADVGFIVAGINHPGDTASDLSRTDDLSIYVQRPNDIKRLIDFMVGTPVFVSRVDSGRIGLFAFSRGGYTGLAVIGASPDWANVTALCEQAVSRVCQQVRAKEFPGQPVHDKRVKAAVIADPLTVFFTAESFGAVQIPVQLWASEYGGDGVRPGTAEVANKNLPVKHEYHLVGNSGHFAFLAPCAPDLAAELPQLCTDRPGFDRVAFHKQFNADVVTFFRTGLLNRP
jgi:predicted dienelactone hydrolase